MSALGAVLAMSVALPFTTGATPAYAAASLTVTKTHEGNFARGGQGVYHIEIRNVGNAETTETVRITDILPAGLTKDQLTAQFDGTFGGCPTNQAGFVCDIGFPVNSAFIVDLTVNVAADAPCIVTNTVTASSTTEGILVSASDPTVITGGSCDDSDGDGGGSVLPVNLSGVVTAFNNTSTNNNLLSPGATNATNQNLGINAP
ncbi:hypothetical protein [Streptomyces sp. NPDC054787]